MLVYLELLCLALLSHDSDEIERLLNHPLARALPRRVREEALSIQKAGKASLIAPVQTLHFQHQTAHLLGVRGGVPASGQIQYELPLKAASGDR